MKFYIYEEDPFDIDRVTRCFLDKHKIPHNTTSEIRNLNNGFQVPPKPLIPNLYSLNPKHSTLTPKHSTLTTHHSTLNTHHSTLNTQHSPLTTHHSTLNTQHSTQTTTNGTTPSLSWCGYTSPSFSSGPSCASTLCEPCTLKKLDFSSSATPRCSGRWDRLATGRRISSGKIGLPGHCRSRNGKRRAVNPVV
jgi:hypothetical protein